MLRRFITNSFQSNKTIRKYYSFFLVLSQKIPHRFIIGRYLYKVSLSFRTNRYICFSHAVRPERLSCPVSSRKPGDERNQTVGKIAPAPPTDGKERTRCTVFLPAVRPSRRQKSMTAYTAAGTDVEGGKEESELMIAGTRSSRLRHTV